MLFEEKKKILVYFTYFSIYLLNYNENSVLAVAGKYCGSRGMFVLAL